MDTAFLLCADPLHPRRPDPHFAGEARAARALGCRVALIDHDALLAGDTEGAVERVPPLSGQVRYRGWMMPSDRYTELAAALAERGAELATAPHAYRAAHELPGWYAAFADVTPRSIWLPTEPGTAPPAAELAGAARLLGGGPGIVKDYVKSRKHEWDEACFVPDLADASRLAAVVDRFVALQGEFLAGGIVLRSFERLGAEARVWWVAGEPVLITAHPDSPGLLPRPDLRAVRPLTAALGFVSTDLALRDDGVWRVVEVGDGQVSDLPVDTDPTGLLKALVSAPSPRGGPTP